MKQLLVLILFTTTLATIHAGKISLKKGTGKVTVEIDGKLFTEYLYPFEITSILIIAVLVGAIVLVKKKDTE